MICIILRNIDTETTDYELLLFGYLKVRLLGGETCILGQSLILARSLVVCGIAHSEFSLTQPATMVKMNLRMPCSVS